MPYNIYAGSVFEAENGKDVRSGISNPRSCGYGILHINVIGVQSARDKILYTGRLTPGVEWDVADKILALKENQEVLILPFSTKSGDPFNAVGFPCPGLGKDLPVELKKPFKAIFHSSAGNVMMISSKEFGCILIEFRFVRDVKALQ